MVANYDYNTDNNEGITSSSIHFQNGDLFSKQRFPSGLKFHWAAGSGEK